MKRRSFITNTLAALPVLSPMLVNAQSNRMKKSNLKIIKSKRLSPGARIGLAAPAGFVTADQLQHAITKITEMGFQPIYSDELLSQRGYFAGNDEIRANTLNRLFNDKSIDGIFCLRGGYGTQRILHLLDYKAIKHNPKPIIGYSDITALLTAIFQKTGLIVFHGPVGISSFSDYTLDCFNKILCNPTNEYVINVSEANKLLALENSDYQTCTIQCGVVEAELIGGNLSLLSTLVGTPYEPDMRGKIVFIEDVHEEPYRIDRMLTHLINSNLLTQAAGIVLGVFTDSDITAGSTNSLSLFEVMLDRLYPLNIPVIYGFSFGHIRNICTLPLGIKARLDVEAQTLTLLEPAVI